MPRAKNLVAARRRRRKLLQQAKGYWGRRKNVHTVAKHAVEKGMQYQYRDRRQRKRQFRRLWIARINAAARLNGTTYSRLIAGLRGADIPLNRKVLADLAIHDATAFQKVAELAKG
jgi:large subunit ribosomal protein L20